MHPYPKCLTALRTSKKNQHQHLIIERLYTSSSLSDVSESVEAAGLLTGSSCSSESTRFLLARDSSSCKKQRKINSYIFFQAPINFFLYLVNPLSLLFIKKTRKCSSCHNVIYPPPQNVALCLKLVVQVWWQK